MSTRRSYLGVGVVDGKIYAVGGDDGNGQRLSSVEQYNPATDTWAACSAFSGAGLAGVGVVAW